MVKKGALGLLLLVVVYDAYLKLQSGIPAVAPVNILFLLTYLLVRGQPDEIANEEPILKKPFFVWWGVLTFAFLLAQVRAFANIVEDIAYWKNAIFYTLFYFLFFKCRLDKKAVRVLIIWIMVIAGVAGLQGIRQGVDYGFSTYNPFKRASGPFGADWHMANSAGVYYAMFVQMFIAFALFLKKQVFWRIAAIVGIVCIVGGTLFTYSRQSYFIIALGLTILLFRKSIVLAVVILALLAGSIGFLPDTVTQRVDETSQQSRKLGGAAEVDESTASRWEIWEGGLGILAHNPMGAGMDRFHVEIGNYSNHKGMDAHNFYVRTTVEYGPIGLIGLVYLIYSMFKLAAFLRKNVAEDDPDAQAIAWGFTVMTISVCFGNFYGSRFLDGGIMAPYWAMAGLAERYVYLKRLENATGTGQVVVVHDPTLEERFPLAAYLRGKR